MSELVSLITGASGGLGQAFAEREALRSRHLVLTSRRTDQLHALASRLREQFKITVDVVPADLTDRAARDGLLRELDERGWRVDTLINNAGFGSIGAFAELGEQRLADELELNAVALTQLTRALLPAMLDNKRGTVINVASTAAFQPIPTMAVYAATKAYVLRFSEALWDELRGSGVRVLALCPGPTRTPFFANAGDDTAMSWRRTPAQVMDTCYAALDKGQPVAIDGPANAVLAHSALRLPLRLVLPITRRIVGH